MAAQAGEAVTVHELSIALRLVELVEDQLRSEAAATAVDAVEIRVGTLSSVVPEALQFAWGPATQDTRLAGAALRIAQQEGSSALELVSLELSDPGP
jgi:hydrogenase nickel incorporation protein HypA/HybF